MEKLDSLRYALIGLRNHQDTGKGELYKGFDEAAQELRGAQREPAKGHETKMTLTAPWEDDPERLIARLDADFSISETQATVQRGFSEHYQRALQALQEAGMHVQIEERRDVQIEKARRRFGDREYLALSQHQMDVVHALPEPKEGTINIIINGDQLKVEQIAYSHTEGAAQLHAMIAKGMQDIAERFGTKPSYVPGRNASIARFDTRDGAPVTYAVSILD